MLVTNVVALWQMRSEFLWGSMLPLVPIVAIGASRSGGFGGCTSVGASWASVSSRRPTRW